jgi:hypothetical protein
MVMLYDSTLGASAASFDVSSLPSGYKHLRIVLSGRSDRAAADDGVLIRFNNDSGANYDRTTTFSSAGASPTSAHATSQTELWFGDVAGASAAAGAIGMVVCDIPDYGGTTFWKMMKFLAGTGGTTFFNEMGMGSWKSTSAINRVTIFPTTGPNFVAGTRLTIYGVDGAPASAVGATGSSGPAGLDGLDGTAGRAGATGATGSGSAGGNQMLWYAI